MKYFLDTNSITNSAIDEAKSRNDIYLIQDVLDEFSNSNAEVMRIKRAGIKVVELSVHHLEKMKDILSTHGTDLKLIDLFLNEGKADVAMLAYIVSEKENPSNLFSINEEYAIVTRDGGLTRIAESYGISCIQSLPID